MSSSSDLVSEASRLLQSWLDKQDHDRCHYYPEIFDQLCMLFGVKNTIPVTRVCRAEFEEGCRRFQDAEYETEEPH